MKIDKKIVEFIKKYPKSFIFIILVSPIIIISFMSFIVNLGTKHIGTKEMIINLQKPIDIGDYIYYYVTTIGIEVTAILSYAVWQTSVESNNLAKEIKIKEDNKDTETIRENALIIYYDLLLGLRDIKKLYVSIKIHRSSPNPKKMFIRNDFIKSIAILRNELSKKEIEEIYDLYGTLLTIKNLLDEFNSNQQTIVEKNLEEEITHLSKKVFKGILINYLQFDLSKDITILLNLHYYQLISKIKSLTYKNVSKEKNIVKGDGEIIFEGDIDENKEFNDANGILYDGDDKNFRFKGKFENGKFISGIEKAYLTEKILFKFKYENSKIISGKLYKEKNHASKLIRLYKKEDEEISRIIKRNLYFNILKFDEEGKPQEGYIEEYNGVYMEESNGEYIEITCSGNDEGDIWGREETIYIGNIKDGKHNGRGFEKRRIRDRRDDAKLLYIGNFVNEKLFEGKCIQERKTNRITKSLEKGNVVKFRWVNWENNRMEAIFRKKELGIGKELYPNGEIYYLGQMKRGGIKEGRGRLYYKNSNIEYKGEFKSGQFDGKGTLYTENGEIIFKGEFKDGKMYNGYKNNYLSKYSDVEDSLYIQMTICATNENINMKKLVVKHEGNISEGKPEGDGKLFIDDKFLNIACKDGIIDQDKFTCELQKLRKVIEL